ncbi:MAG: Cobalamin-binding protein precursor [Methanosaeta sp. PtaU1.Bin060]|nr:MAG: Cobalamin-binding protein precursor [Methanosaeta sp. PtaU1.Bin060]
MNKKLLGYLLIALMLLSCLGACEDAKAKTVTIADGTGHSVDVPVPAERIVSIDSHLSEIIYALEAGDRIVGRDSYTYFPASLKDVPVVAASSYKPDVEAILKINPDLVVADSMLSKDDRKKIEAAGIPVMVETSLDPTNVATLVEHLGVVLDKEDRANEIVLFIKRYQDIVDERISGLKAADKPAVFFEWGSKPYKSAGSGTIFHNLTVAAGGMNIVADQTVQYPTVDAEWIAKRDPDIIVRDVSTTAEENLTDKMMRTRNEIISRQGLSDVKAIKDGRVYALGAPLAAGIRSIIGELYLAKWFHPDLFEDIDPETIDKEFLQKFFGEEPKEKGVYP